jgi:hypothetical protein
MMGHLSNEELTDFLLQRDERRLRPTLDALAGWTRTVADRPESFWERQRAGVWARRSARSKRAAQRLGALAGTLCLALLAVVLFRANRPPAQAPLGTEGQRDHELLLRVEQTIASDGPQALAPAALLAQEISRDRSSAPGQQHASQGGKHE